MTKKRRRILLWCLVVLVACSFVIWRVTRPGWAHPSASEIDSMEAKIFRLEGHLHKDVFMVPNEDYEEILSALSPSRYDGLGAKWQILGELDIRTADGPSIKVFLMDTGEDDPVGAFAAGSTWESRTYYRGGNSARLRSALEKASAKTATH